MRATLALLPLAAALAGCISVTATDVSGTPPRAATGDFGEASLINASGARIGRAVLTQGATGLLIRIEADGLTPGWHGVHIHATGECAAPFTSAGARFSRPLPLTWGGANLSASSAPAAAARPPCCALPPACFWPAAARCDATASW